MKILLTASILVLMHLLTGCQQYYKASLSVGQCFGENYGNAVIEITEKKEFGARITVVENGTTLENRYMLYENFDKFTERDCLDKNKD